MTEPQSNPTPAPAATPAPGENPSNPTPAPAANPPESNALTEEQIQAAIKDKRLWTHPRIKEALESASELKKIKEQQEAKETESLKEQNKWKELAERNEAQVKTL